MSKWSVFLPVDLLCFVIDEVDVVMVKVDMTKPENADLRYQFGIRNFPALKLFKRHSDLPYEYRGPRDHAEAIAHYLEKERRAT